MKLKLTNIFIYFCIIIISLYIVSQIFMPHISMKYFGFQPFVVMSSSMEPQIKVNDVVIIKNVKEEDLQVHDIIMFEVYLPKLKDKGLVTHYIGSIETLEDGTRIYYTQGASKGPGEYDQWTDEYGEPKSITYQDIKGEAIFTIPYVGHLIQIFRDPVMVLLLGLNGVIIYTIIKLIKSPKSNTKNT